MERNKHDHKATKKLKAWLFGIMLLLPFLFMLPTGLYYGLNQNAQLSERTEQQPVYYQSNEVNSNTDLIIGNIYEFERKSQDLPITTITLECNDIIYLEGTKYSNSTLPSYELPYFRNGGGNDVIVIYTDGDSYILSGNIKIIFTLRNIIAIDTNAYINIKQTDYQLLKEYQPVTYINDISTSIINAWNSTWQNPLFSWTNNTFITTTINNFTNGFGITAETYISNLITYIAILTAVYIIFDIVIELFTKLTHIIPRSD